MNEPTGRAKGGAARALALSPERRREIALLAADGKKKKFDEKRALNALPKSSHRGEFTIGDITIPCCVLADGRRLVSELGINATLGSSGGKSYRLRDAAIEDAIGPMPLFLASKALQPFIHAVFDGMDLTPVEYADGDKISIGYEATILPKVCEVWLQAKEEGALQTSQHVKAKKAEILMRGLAQVGIIALVDEATGYQRDRARDALAKILEAYVAKELQPYVKTFDAGFYEQMFRLRGIPFPPEKAHYRPGYFGHLTNDMVYRRLAPGVLVALKDEAKKLQKSTKLFQHLTAGYGRQELLKHLGMVVGLMKISSNWQDFMGKINQVSPRFGETIPLELEEKDR